MCYKPGQFICSLQGEKFFLTVVVVSCYKNMNPKSVCIAAISAARTKATRHHGPEGHGEKMLNGLEQHQLHVLMKLLTAFGLSF